MKLRLVPPEEKDFPQMMEIERFSFTTPWTAKEFMHTLWCRNISCMALRSNSFFRQNLVLGYVVFRTGLKKLEIWNLAVRPDRRRHGHGTQLIAYLKERAERGTRKSVEVTISEQNLAGHLFFQANGFRATNVLRGFYAEDHDAYEMLWSPSVPGRNRLLGGRHAADFFNSAGGASAGEGVG